MSTEKHGEDPTPGEEVRGWFAGRLPDGWFTGPPEVLVDREEITVVGPLGDLDPAPDASPAAQAAAADGRARRFREETRDHRIEIAREAELKFSRTVSWGVICGGRKVMFTTLSVPVMTRLRRMFTSLHEYRETR